MKTKCAAYGLMALGLYALVTLCFIGLNSACSSGAAVPTQVFATLNLVLVSIWILAVFAIGRENARRSGEGEEFVDRCRSAFCAETAEQKEISKNRVAATSLDRVLIVIVLHR